MPTTTRAAEASKPCPKVGSFWRVKRHDGTGLVAEILQKSEDGRFYVHFVTHDRRMDEWIDLEQFVEEEFFSAYPSKRRKQRTPLNTPPSLENSAEQHTLAERLEVARERMTRVKNVPAIVFSGWEVETWYWSPFPEAYHGLKLYICDYTLMYSKRRKDLVAHASKYKGPRHPPGRKVYAGSAGISLWEVRGRDERLYCQNLCLIAKLFLDHKTLYYDVDPFVFYVLTEYRNEGHHVLGYFSKERTSADDYNLACILTFPQFQRRGFGTLLISLSYELTKLEGKQGSPEKPLSDLGKISYRSYWTWTILTSLKQHLRSHQKENMNLDKLGRASGIKNEDIFSTLHHLNMLRYWKGQAVIRLDEDEIDSLIGSIKRPPRLCEPENITIAPS